MPIWLAHVGVLHTSTRIKNSANRFMIRYLPVNAHTSSDSSPSPKGASFVQTSTIRAEANGKNIRVLAAILWKKTRAKAGRLT